MTTQLEWTREPVEVAERVAEAEQCGRCRSEHGGRAWGQIPCPRCGHSGSRTGKDPRP